MSIPLNQCDWYNNGTPLVRLLAERIDNFVVNQVSINVLDLAKEIAALPEEPPLAWRYELAHARVWTGGKPTGWSDWRQHTSDFEPCAPKGSIKNLTPLYARPSGLTDEERDLIREWYDATSDASPGYLEKKDHDLAAKLGFKVDKSQGKSFREALKLMLDAWDDLPEGHYSARTIGNWLASDAWRNAVGVARKVLGS